jgi:plastocyanin
MKLLTTIGILSSTIALAAITSGMASNEAAPAKNTVTGSVTGKVVFDGKPAAAKPLTIGAEQSVGCCPEGVDMDTTDRSLMVGADGGIANVVVTIEIDGMKAEIPGEALKLDQSKCHFEPHILVVPVGGKVAYLNSDTVSHNIHTYGKKNDGINKTVSGGTSVEQELGKAEAIKVACDIHPWMSSYIVVTDASVWATTKADGSFEIAGLAPGDYKIKLWHEKLGKGSAEATVGADGASAPIEVKMGDKKKKKKKRR